MKLSILAIATSGLIALASPIWADTKPKGAKPAPAQAVANLYVGKTQNWKTCKAGIYYGGEWAAQAYCDKKGKSVGLGKWSVSRRGDVCHELTWYWPEGKKVGSKKDKAECIAHVIDPEGVIWRKFANDGDDQWWRIEKSKSLVKGFKHKGKVNRMRRKLGV